MEIHMDKLTEKITDIKIEANILMKQKNRRTDTDAYKPIAILKIYIIEQGLK